MRVAIIFVLIALPMSLAFVLLAIPQARFENLLPVLSRGSFPVVKPGFVQSGNVQEMSLFFLLISYVAKIEKVLRTGVFGLVVVMSAALVVVVVAISVFGVPETTPVLAPGFSVVQEIEQPTVFVERLTSLGINNPRPMAGGKAKSITDDHDVIIFDDHS